jgi:RecA/RadA recombinase
MAKSKKTKSFSISQMSDLIDKISDETKIILENDGEQGYINTDIYIMNALLSKSILTGGVADDRITIFAGPPNTGKSYLVYNIARNAQKQGKFILFIDTEHSVNRHVLQGFGIKTDQENLKLISSNKVEDLKIFLTKFLDGLKTAKDDGAEIPEVVIFLDSIGQLASEKEKADALEGKNKQDMTRAKSIKQLFRVINSDLGYLGIPMIATNHTYEDTTSFFPTQIMSGGKGAEYSASTIVFLSTAKLKTGREDELDLNSSGVIVTAQAKKNRIAKPKKVKFEIDHEYGTNKYRGLEFFCTPENFEKVGIAKGKKTEKDGIIGISPGGTRWYVKHLDKAVFEKNLFTSEIFTKEVLESLEPIIYKYFDYSSFEEQQTYVEKMDNDEIIEDADFDEIDDSDLFS